MASTPEVQSGPGYFVYIWAEEQIRIELDRVQPTRDGEIKCDLTVYDMSYTKPRHLHGARFNLSSESARNTRRRTLTERKTDVDWFGILEQVCQATLTRLRQGEPTKRYGEDEIMKTAKWLIEPFVPEELTGAIFGHPGIGKSVFAQAIAAAAQTNYGGFGFTPERQVNVLVLDWEMSWDIWAQNFRQLEAGMGLPQTPNLLYDHPKHILAHETQRIHRLIVENDIGLAIIDSAIPACGGEPTLVEPTESFFNALRQLPGSKLIICQTSREEAKQKYIYGNQLWTYECRSIWEMRKVQEIDANNFSIGLFHTKCNVDRLHRPMGFDVAFDNMFGITISPKHVEDIPEFEAQLPLKQRIANILKQGAMSDSEIAEELEISKDSVRTTCNRNKDRFVRVGANWGLLHNKI